MIQFRVNYQVNQKRKFEKFLENYQSETGYKLKDLKILKYWKIEGQFQAEFHVESNSSQNNDKVCEVLDLANALCHSGTSNWTFIGPFKNDPLSFECILNDENDDQPLKWAHIELAND